MRYRSEASDPGTYWNDRGLATVGILQMNDAAALWHNLRTAAGRHVKQGDPRLLAQIMNLHDDGILKTNIAEMVNVSAVHVGNTVRAGSVPMLRSLVLGGLLSVDDANDLLNRFSPDRAVHVAFAALASAQSAGSARASGVDVYFAIKSFESNRNSTAQQVDSELLQTASATATGLTQQARIRPIRASDAKDALELAGAMLSLSEVGIADVDIQRFLTECGLQFSAPQIGDQLKLASAPRQVREVFATGIFVPSAIILMIEELLREGCHPDELISIVEDAVGHARVEGVTLLRISDLREARHRSSGAGLDKDLTPTYAAEEALVRLGSEVEVDGVRAREDPSAYSKAIEAYSAGDEPFDPQSAHDARQEVLRSIKARRGQKSFRDALIAAYAGRCAFTSCGVLDVLEAAHITPYLGPATNSVSNGLLLRADLHTLFDTGLIAVDPDTLNVLVAPRVKDAVYRSLHGRRLRATETEAATPSLAALRQHRLTCQW